MKHFYLLLFTTALGTSAWAQTPTFAPAERRHLLDFGAGQSLNGSGDYLCQKTHLGYTRRLGRSLSVGSRVAMISGSRNMYFGNGLYLPLTYHAVNVESETYYAPFGHDRRFVFAIGAGAYVGHTRQHDYEYAHLRRTYNQQYELDYKLNNVSGLHIGYLASLNADYAVDYQQRWLLGLKLALQNDTYNNILPGAQLRLARRL